MPANRLGTDRGFGPGVRPRPIDSALVLSSFALASVIAVVRPWPVVLGAAIVALSMTLSGSLRPARAAVLAAIVLGLLASLRARRMIDADARATARALDALPRTDRCELVGVIDSMPRMRGVISADVLVESLVCDARAPPAFGLRARIHDLGEAPTRGARVRIVAQLAPSRRPFNPDLGDPRPGYARRGHSLSGTAITIEVTEPGRGIVALLDRTRARLRRGISAAFAADVAPIARAMVLGEEDLTESDDEAFRRSGLTHLLAVSGSHVALVVGGLVALLRLLLLRSTYLARRVEVGRVAAAIGVPLACIYEQLAGDSGSARRATIMAVVVLLVRVVGRRVDLPRTLGLSILAALAVDPLAPFDLSFALSIAATIGLIALGPAADVVLARVRPAMLRSAIAATVSASLACAPLIAGISGTLPLLGVIANLVAVPIGELAALPLCNLAALGGAVLPEGASRVIGDAAAGSLVLLRGVARVAATPDHAVLTVSPPTTLQLAVIVAVVIVMLISAQRRLVVGTLGLAAFMLLELGHVRRSRPHGVLRVTILDVGQGDATLVDLPGGGALLIDAGGEVGSSWDPGRAVVAPVLAARRRGVLDVAVLSHPHPDHFLGLRAALARARPRVFWENGHAGTTGELGSLMTNLRARGVAVASPATLCGSRVISGATIEVLHPCPTADPDRSANDNSLVLRIAYGRRAVLLVGDAEHEAEAALLLHPERLRADLLKVGHHGSRTSSSAPFLAAVKPSVATLSCGVRNRFGHPHLNAVTSLRRTGAQLFRTDVDGAIRWTTDGETVEVVTAVAGW